MRLADQIDHGLAWRLRCESLSIPGAMANLEIHRKRRAWADRARKYKLIVDGEERGTIARGETVRLDLQPGTHAVKLKIDWCASEELTVEIVAGATVKLRCQPRANPLTALWYVWIGRSRWIRLAPAEA